MVFAELEIISAALYSDDPVVQNPRHMEGACAHFFAIHPSCAGLLQNRVFIFVSMEGLRPTDSISSGLLVHRDQNPSNSAKTILIL